MNIIFKDRSNNEIHHKRYSTGMVAESYSHSVIGGPNNARLTVTGNSDPYKYLELLRYPVTVYGDSGKPVWWGYVNTIKAGGYRISLDEMYNNVAVHYGKLEGGEVISSEVTAFTSLWVSVTEFGYKEYVADMSAATSTTAELRRDMFITAHARPVITHDLSPSDKVTIECKGWWNVLSWRYSTLNWHTEAWADFHDWTAIARASILTDTENATFLTPGVITSGGGTIEECWDWTRHDKLLGEWMENIGYTDGRRALAWVRPDRKVDLYPEPVESVEYVIDREGKLRDQNNRIIDPELCKTGVWAVISDLPSTAGGVVTARPFFVEEAEYNAKQNKTTYRPANVRDPFRITEVK